MESEPSRFENFLSETLADIESRGLLRTLRHVESPQDTTLVCGGKTLANFSSNDYLGLANHPALLEAARDELAVGGFGAGASRLVCGNLSAHERLETSIARFKRVGAALTFSSGYAAALGTIPAICGKGDVLILDKLCHACMVDASRLSGAHVRVFPHNDTEKLDSHLAWANREHPGARVLVLAESIYSMDGDAAPLRKIVDLKDRYGAWLFLDEAHGVGVLGENGRGLADSLGLAGRIEIQMGTLGKALGAHGAYIAGSQTLRSFLINCARSFIYTTAPPTPVAAAAARAIEILESPEGAKRVSTLRKNIDRLGSALGLARPASAIIPLIIGTETDALDASRQLFDAGFLVPAIRYPVVAKGTARLRITLSANHHPEQIDALARQIAHSGLATSAPGSI